ncbi:hypothetical protein B0A48_07975 [Cryoendolithus antarcticus]|uniref:Uncharacterized protein n=1 Tax=Cryoendolithus antarcticus TaxID=1507870 RepID=A0A1V8T0M0_9PEZI|nr:hypothetical protein B0A48_07975 [Cryoendolithus antarcticus]
MPLARPTPLPRYSHTKGHRPPHRKTTRKELTPLQRAFISGFLESGGSGREITRRFGIPHNTALRVLRTARARAEELGVGMLDGRCYETRERGHRVRVEVIEREGGGGEDGENGRGGEDGENGRGGEGKGVIRVKSHMQGGCLVRGYVRKRPADDAEKGGRGNKKKMRMSAAGQDGVIDPALRQREMQGTASAMVDIDMSNVDFTYAA